MMTTSRVEKPSNEFPFSIIELTEKYQGAHQCKCNLIPRMWTSWTNDNSG